MEKPILKIVKIGGNVIEDAFLLNDFLKDFSAMEGFKILVHGGGKKATELSKSLGLEPKMVNGRRVTDTANLELVTMVYAGLINKNMVAQLQKCNCNALGLSGADANVIKAHKRVVKEVDYGFAGDVDAVNGLVLTQFLQQGLTPVFCAITHDKNGQLLNTNADTVASEIAVEMANYFTVELHFLFELKGVLRSIDDENSVIEQMDLESYQNLVEKGVIAGGMLPKLHNCFNALQKGVAKVKIGNAQYIKNPNSIHTTLSLK